jgi:hypothetical protein
MYFMLVTLLVSHELMSWSKSDKRNILNMDVTLAESQPSMSSGMGTPPDSKQLGLEVGGVGLRVGLNVGLQVGFEVGL